MNWNKPPQREFEQLWRQTDEHARGTMFEQLVQRLFSEISFSFNETPRS